MSIGWASGDRPANKFGQRTGSGSGEIVGRTQYAHATPRVENEQIIVTADDSFRSGSEGELQILIVLWITAISDRYRGLKPDGRAAQYFQDPFTPRKRDCPRKPGAVQNSGDLAIDRGRESEHLDFLGTQQRALRNAVRLERRAYEG